MRPDRVPLARAQARRRTRRGGLALVDHRRRPHRVSPPRPAQAARGDRDPARLGQGLARPHARLPSKLRDAVVLRYLEELSTRETAFLLGITEANVRVRLQRARSLLRARLPMRLAYALFAVPWIVADSAEAATVKAGAAVVALATAGVFVAAALEGEPPA
ncbi:MAG: RNA polymerase sigma factor, partial [Planctomycetota bacterium]